MDKHVRRHHTGGARRVVLITPLGGSGEKCMPRVEAGRTPRVLPPNERQPRPPRRHQQAQETSSIHASIELYQQPNMQTDELRNISPSDSRLCGHCVVVERVWVDRVRLCGMRLQIVHHTRRTRFFPSWRPRTPRRAIDEPIDQALGPLNSPHHLVEVLLPLQQALGRLGESRAEVRQATLDARELAEKVGDGVEVARDVVVVPASTALGATPPPSPLGRALKVLEALVCPVPPKLDPHSRMVEQRMRDA